MLEPTAGFDRVAEMYESMVRMELQESETATGVVEDDGPPALEKRWVYDNEVVILWHN
jgi:hypothetical protein